MADDNRQHVGTTVSDNKLTIISVLFVIAVGIFLSEVQNRIGYKELIISVVIIGVIYAFSSYVVFNKISSNLKLLLESERNMYEQNIKNINENICSIVKQCSEHTIKTNCLVDEKSKDFINHLKKLFQLESTSDWIITTEELENFELINAKSEVWIISSDLEEDGTDGPFFKIVEKNIERGIVYRYFVPKNDVIVSRVSRMRNKLLKFDNNNTYYYFLEDSFFFLFSKFDFGIINPTENRKDRHGFMGIDTPDGKARFQVRLSDNLIEIFVAKLQNYITP